jgi:hypothetical protein
MARKKIPKVLLAVAGIQQVSVMTVLPSLY